MVKKDIDFFSVRVFSALRVQDDTDSGNAVHINRVSGGSAYRLIICSFFSEIIQKSNQLIKSSLLFLLHHMQEVSEVTISIAVFIKHNIVHACLLSAFLGCFGFVHIS